MIDPSALGEETVEVLRCLRSYAEMLLAVA